MTQWWKLLSHPVYLLFVWWQASDSDAKSDSEPQKTILPNVCKDYPQSNWHFNYFWLHIISGDLIAHISVSLVWQMRPHCWFPFSTVSPEFGTTLLATGNDWKEKREQWQAWANNLSVIKAAEWRRTLCTIIGEGQGEGGVVKQIAATQSSSDTAVHGMELGGVRLQSINHNRRINVKQQQPIHWLVQIHSERMAVTAAQLKRSPCFLSYHLITCGLTTGGNNRNVSECEVRARRRTSQSSW